MDRPTIFQSITAAGIVPIIRTSNTEAAIDAVKAIHDGGINVIEVTMTVPGAIRVLEHVASRMPEVLLGAGTVLDAETARACILAGAQFLVTPALRTGTIEMARRYSKPIMPGALTPTEVLTAWEHGADAVKIFPCSAVGGAKYIKALKAPLPQVEMIPTGGVNLETVGDFLRAGACAVAVGSELVDEKTIQEKRYEVFTERARKFLEAVRSARSGTRSESAVG